jgi:hypothetical protein
MDPLFTSAIAMSIAVAIAMVAIAMRVRQNRERSAARVEALQELVAEYSGPSGSHLSAEALAKAEVLGSSGSLGPSGSAGPLESNDDWDLRLHAEGYDDVPEYDDAPEVTTPVAAPAQVPAVRVAPATPQFVVHVPDSAGGRPWQVSFEQRESQS